MTRHGDGGTSVLAYSFYSEKQSTPYPDEVRNGNGGNSLEAYYYDVLCPKVYLDCNFVVWFLIIYSFSIGRRIPYF
jgi:hypothetical protein